MPFELSSSSFAGDDAGIARRPCATQQGRTLSADPSTIEEVVTVLRAAGDVSHGRRLRGRIVVLWRAGVRINEALALNEADLDHRRGFLLIRQRQLGHGNLGITSIYLQGVDNTEIIETVHARRAPMIAVSTSLGL